MFGASGNIVLSGGIQLKNTNPYTIPRGNVLYTAPGTYTFTVPTDVYSVSFLVIGPGASGTTAVGSYTSTNYYSGGGGGGLAYRNLVPVTPGDSITVTIGQYGSQRTSSTGSGDYSIISSNSRIVVNGVTTVATCGDRRESTRVAGYPWGTYDGGGRGGNAGSSYHTTYNSGGGVGGGGGAAGYSGNGGSGGWADGIGQSAGTGGGGGGGNGSSVFTAQVGGGVGVYGQGTNGVAGVTAGSGGTLPNYGGGGGAQRFTSGIAASNGGLGAVRIIWGYNRKFPNTNTAVATEGFDTYIA